MKIKKMKIKKLTSILLSILIAVSFIPAYAFAEEDLPYSSNVEVLEEDTKNEVTALENQIEQEKPLKDEEGPSYENNDKTTKASVESKSSESEIIDSGTCGKDGSDVYWTLYSDHSLVISGSGEMMDFGSYTENENGNSTSLGDAPWYSAALDASITIDNITIQQGITTIGFGAFSRCNITELHFPNTVTALNGCCFDRCSNLNRVYLPSSIQYLGPTFHNDHNPDTYYTGTLEGFLEIKKKIYNIGNLFINNELVTELEFPDGTTEISDYAMFGAESIKEVTVPSGVVSIGRAAFSSCSNLSSIELPKGLVSIGRGAFTDSAITSIDLPSSVNNIEKEAFSHCTLLKNICLPDGVSTINESTFYNCRSLKLVDLPNSIVRIEPFAFGCCRINDIVIPESVTFLGEYAFARNIAYGMGGSTVILKCAPPETVTNALTDCQSIKYICSKWTDADFNAWNPDVEWIPLHDYAADTIVIRPTCTESGSQIVLCTACGNKATEKISALGHDWSTTPTVDKAATCTEAGSESIHCSRCGEIEEGTTHIIPATGHSYSAWVTTIAATEANAGQQSRTCSKCEATETQVIAQLAPTLPAVKISKPKAAKKKITVKWKKVSKKNQKKIQGIEIQVATDPDFKNIVKTSSPGKKKTSKVFKGLTSKTIYYVRVRAYNNSGGPHRSAWSAVKPVKVK